MRNNTKINMRLLQSYIGLMIKWNEDIEIHTFSERTPKNC